jgi:beta-ureidopropionase / N-carbamoyl-L-amino-acid hydrolase
MSADFRHARGETLDLLVDGLGAVAREIEDERMLDISIERFWTSEPTPFDAGVVAAVEAACGELGLGHGRLWSGAGHDAKYAQDVWPAGMIFVRSEGGLSHCEDERSSPEDLEAGANVLLRAAVALAVV